MLKSLQLENYRGFRRYRLDGLARVNLLVGKNNCGKTSILEAVRILAAQGDPRVLAEIATRRGERIAAGDASENSYADVSPFFHGYEFGSGKSLSLHGEIGCGHLELKVARLSEIEKTRQLQFAHPSGVTLRRGASVEEVAVQLGNHLFVEITGGEHRPLWPLIPASDSGALLLEPSFFGVGEPADAVNIQLITTESLPPRAMASMWDAVLTEGREADVIRALKILEPEISNVFFLSGERASRNGRGGILVAFEDPKRKRVPLGNFGEGIRRMLALALSLDQARGGILLVDEIDTGLHYSILGDMWLMLVNAAKAYDVQVFATTHSQDCIRGLAWLCERHPDLGVDVSVQKIDPDLDESIDLDSEKLQIAVEQAIEVR